MAHVIAAQSKYAIGDPKQKTYRLSSQLCQSYTVYACVYVIKENYSKLSEHVFSSYCI